MEVVDQLDKALGDYLAGRGAKPDLVDRIFEEGPKLVGPLLRANIPVLKSTGAPLAMAMRKWDQLAERIGEEEAGRQNFQAEMEAGRPVDLLFFRTERAITQIAVFPQ